MKKILIAASIMLLAFTSAQAQDLKFGAKIGANFSKLSGEGPDGDNLTSFHVGVLTELNLIENLSLQGELLYSSQGTELNNEDYKLDYISVPVLAKLYLITDKLSLEAGPQFSFLLNDDVPDTFRTKTFDFAAVGGLGYNLTQNIFVQARYVVGLTDASREAAVTNKVIQLSAGLRF